MISLDKLRKKSGLLIVGIGIAMAAFLLGDLMNSGTSLFNTSSGVVGEINNQVIDYGEFETEVQTLDRIFNGTQDRSLLRDNLWSDKVNEVVMNDQYDQIGLTVGPEELAGLTFGYKSGEMSLTAKQFFGISEQEVSTEQLASLAQQINENDPQRWIYFENIIRKERLSQKYNNLISQALVVSSIDADAHYNELATQATGRYLFKPFDSDVEATDSEVLSYYKANKDDYPQSENRELAMAVFEIAPTEKDQEERKNYLEDLIEDKQVYNKITNKTETVQGFRNTTDVESFVEKYSDESFDEKFYAEGQLSPAIETIMREAKEGFVYGPYIEENSYKIARLNSRKNDSIQVAIVEVYIEASEETSNKIYTQAIEMAAAKDYAEFETIAEEKNVAISSAIVEESDRVVAGLGQARNIVFWAYSDKTQVNSVKLDDQNNRIVVLMLTNITEEGVQPLEEVRPEIEIAVKREKSSQSLTEEFNQQIEKTKSFEELTTAMNMTAEKASLMSFTSNVIPQGFEPSVVGAFYGLEEGQMSQPIVGENGLYVVVLDETKRSAAPKNYSSIKKQLEGQKNSRPSNSVFSALKEKASIEDNRAKLY